MGYKSVCCSLRSPKRGRERQLVGRVWAQILMFMFITPSLNERIGTKALKLVKFWLIFVTVKLPKLLHLYASWLSEVLAFRDMLHTVLNSAGFFYVEVELQ